MLFSLLPSAEVLVRVEKFALGTYDNIKRRDGKNVKKEKNLAVSIADWIGLDGRKSRVGRNSRSVIWIHGSVQHASSLLFLRASVVKPHFVGFSKCLLCSPETVTHALG